MLLVNFAGGKGDGERKHGTAGGLTHQCLDFSKHSGFIGRAITYKEEEVAGFPGAGWNPWCFEFHKLPSDPHQGSKLSWKMPIGIHLIQSHPTELLFQQLRIVASIFKKEDRRKDRKLKWLTGECFRTHPPIQKCFSLWVYILPSGALPFPLWLVFCLVFVINQFDFRSGKGSAAESFSPSNGKRAP